MISDNSRYLLREAEAPPPNPPPQPPPPPPRIRKSIRTQETN